MSIHDPVPEPTFEQLLDRALTYCPSLSDKETIVRYLHMLGFEAAKIGPTELDEAIDRARVRAT